MSQARIALSGLALALTAVVAACGRDSASPRMVPTTPSARAVALHLDSLYARTVAAGTNGGLAIRAHVLTYAELAPAYGAVPSAINTSTVTAGGDSTVHTWAGFEIELVTTNVDTTWYFVAYSDSDVTNAVVFAVTSPNAGSFAALLANDTVAVSTDQFFGAMAPAPTVGATCSPVAGLSNPLLAAYAHGTCNLATFNSLMVGSFALPPGVDPSFAKIIVKTTTWNGVIFRQ